MSKPPHGRNLTSHSQAVEARQQAARALSQAERLVLLTHDRPDGDGLGSMAGLARAARAAGKRVQLAAGEELPRRYAFLMEGEEILRPAGLPAAIDAADTVVVLDTCVWNQLESSSEALRKATEKILVIDHHLTREQIGRAQWCDEQASAVGVMITEMLIRLGWPTDLGTAEALMTAVVSDTGWLRFSNTDSRTLRAVAHWLDMGADPSALYRRLYESDRPNRIALLGRMLGGMELHFNGQLAMMSITRDDFAATGAGPDETENLINEALRIGSVEAAVLMVEMPDTIRVSLRSKSAVDVARLAQQFGGGGHARAAGLRLAEPLPAVREKLLAALAKEFR